MAKPKHPHSSLLPVLSARTDNVPRETLRVFVAKVETKSHRYLACGVSGDEALSMLRTAWKDLAANDATGEEEPDWETDVHLQVFETGIVLRDGTIVWPEDVVYRG